MHKIGDVVRLNKGWTPMIVLHVDPCGEVWATYASKYEAYSITQWHYENYREVYSYHRANSEFSVWDGEPINTEWNYIMKLRYVCPTTGEKGTFLNKTSTGDFVLELDKGTVEVYRPFELIEDIPNTFRVKALNSSYTAHYVTPNGATITVGDLLISKSNNVYVVLETDTKIRTPKGVFNGSRILKEGL